MTTEESRDTWLVSAALFVCLGMFALVLGWVAASVWTRPWALVVLGLFVALAFAGCVLVARRLLAAEQPPAARSLVQGRGRRTAMSTASAATRWADTEGNRLTGSAAVAATPDRPWKWRARG